MVLRSKYTKNGQLSTEEFEHGASLTVLLLMIIENIFAGQDKTIDESCSVFLAGPSAGDVEMLGGWRRSLKDRLSTLDSPKLDKIQLIMPEPESGLWSDVITDEYNEEDQTNWEYEAMLKSKVIAFWLPTFWTPEKAGAYPPNIGPSTRFEFGFFLHEALKNPRRGFIVGSPREAQSLTWAKVITKKYGYTWHYPDPNKNWEMVPAAFIQNIVSELVALKDI